MTLSKRMYVMSENIIANAVPENLQAFFRENSRIALAFSGGVDSAYLLYAAKACGCAVRAYYVKSAFQPEFEREDARKLARMLDADMTEIPLDVLSVENVAENPENRCYFCKRAIFTKLAEQAVRDGYNVIIDGTNASDDAGDRPGMRALAELKVLSPLRMCGITKAQVREYSRTAGLFTWNKPAYACLATRIPAGRRIDNETLGKIEKAEDSLFGMGFSDFRVRLYGDGARLQLPEGQMIQAIEKRDDILRALGAYFPDVMLDLKNRG